MGLCALHHSEKSALYTCVTCQYSSAQDFLLHTVAQRHLLQPVPVELGSLDCVDIVQRKRLSLRS